MPDNFMLKQLFKELIEEAKQLGATDSAILASREISVRDDLAALCNGKYTCPNYGLAKNCPPYVEGPDVFRGWQQYSEYAVIVKIELSTSVLFSDQRKRVMQLLHQIVSGVEHKAALLGFENSRAFAGGSCKDLFCRNRKYCCVIHGNELCRHKDLARPSMSGYGIDVVQLMESSGWSGQKAEESEIQDNDALTWVAGLIMLA